MYKALDNVHKNTKKKLHDSKFVGDGKGRLTSVPNGVVLLHCNAIYQNTDPSALGDEKTEFFCSKNEECNQGSSLP